MVELMSTRYSNVGINTISDVEVFKCSMYVKHDKKQIYHVRLDYNAHCSAWDNLVFFAERVLPTISQPFVCILSGEDLTFPNQLDVRWREPHNLALIRRVYNGVVNHPQLIHCFIENRDEVHPKTSSLPIGINPREMPNLNIDYIIKYLHSPLTSLIENRPLKVISIHRNRPGDREKINILNHTSWKDIVICSGNYSQDTWWELLRTYPFVVCAHGGGIDPCPKVWEALCVGCIPIIKHSVMDDVYSQLPIVIVDEWNETTLAVENLIKWREQFSPFFNDQLLKETWTPKLYLNYWKEQVLSKLI